jgi:hypothetical protein
MNGIWSNSAVRESSEKGSMTSMIAKALRHKE